MIREQILFNNMQRLRKIIQNISLFLLAGLFSIMLRPRQVHAVTLTSTKEANPSKFSGLFFSGGGYPNRNKYPVPQKAPKKKGVEVAIFSGAIAGTTLGLVGGGLKKKEIELVENEEIYHDIMDPVFPEQLETFVFETEASKGADEKKAHGSAVNAAEAEEPVLALSSEQGIASTSYSVPMIGSYIDTGAHLNSLVKTNFFKTEQDKKGEIRRKLDIVAAEKAAKEKEDAKKEAAKALQDEADAIAKTNLKKDHLSSKSNKLVQPLSAVEDNRLSEKYAKLALEDRAFQILLDLGMVQVTPNPDDPDYDSTYDEEFAPENVFVEDTSF